MKIWFDTEFIEDGNTIGLISIGMVREDGRMFYAENSQCEFGRASDWVKQNVFPHLDKGASLMTQREIAVAVRDFAGDAPEFWAYYADYDWVALCQLYGTMMDLPKGWPMFCMDIKQLCVSVGDPKLPEQGRGEHNALLDAQWNREAWEFLGRVSPDKDQVCDEILSIMATYDEQAEKGDIGTPGGLEHMGDVWRLLRGWQRQLKVAP